MERSCAPPAPSASDLETDGEDIRPARLAWNPEISFLQKICLMAGLLRGTFVISPVIPESRFNRKQTCIGIIAMNILELCLVVQLCLAFGVAGLIWPEKFRPVFDVLLFPWAASYRAVRINSIAAIGLSVLLLARLILLL